MNYNIFRFDAVVDFIEIRIETVQPTKGHTVKARCGVSYADRPNKQHGDGGAASVFDIRLYDLKNFRALQAKIDDIKRAYELVRDPVITRIEVAFDAYANPKVNEPATPAQLVQMAAHMFWHCANPVSKNRRMYWDYRGSARQPSRSSDGIVQGLTDGWNIGIGNRADDWYQHVYWKVTDHNKKPIPVSDYRARFEIRLAGAGLPVQMFPAWRDFKFESLARYISFRTVDENMTALDRMLLPGLAFTAANRLDRKRKKGRKTLGGGVQAFRPSTPADVDLNRIVRQQLQNLSRRWNPEKRNRN